MVLITNDILLIIDNSIHDSYNSLNHSYIELSLIISLYPLPLLVIMSVQGPPLGGVAR